MKRTVFELLHESNDEPYGRITFNGKFVFELYDSVGLETWNKIGFIKLDESGKIESDDLFQHLNSRLPITLRYEKNEDKIHYIQKTGLRVASDKFYLKEIAA